MTNKLWQFLAVIAIIIILMSWLLKTTQSSGGRWQQLNGVGLQHKIQGDLRQVYWQWQDEGRPKRIRYQPENVIASHVVPMTSKGKPFFSPDVEGCRQFLSWFVDADIVEKKFKVSALTGKQKETVDSIQKLMANEPISTIEGWSEQESVTCQYEFLDFLYTYNAVKGELRFTKLE